MWNYELFQDRAGNWRWHLLSHGRRVATCGQAFASRYDAERAMIAVRENASGASLPAESDPSQILRRALLAAARRNAAKQAALGSRIFGPR